MNITAHERARCRDPPKKQFYRRKKKVSVVNGPTIKHVMFLRKYKEKPFVCGQNVLTEGVFVTNLSSNTGIAV
jgi:hypothetical protein